MATETASVLFTDIVGSTALLQRLGEDVGAQFMRTHDQLMATAVEAAGGRVVKGLGDGIMAVFGAAADAVEAAVSAQRAADSHSRGVPEQAFAIRVGISVGDVSEEDGDYLGTAVVEAARLCDAAQGGQILVADLVRALSRGRGGHIFESVGELELKGLSATVPACYVSWEPASRATETDVPFPPLLAPTTSVSYTGRLGLLATLQKAWDLVSGGEGAQTILLAGEPGVGKTRTSSEMARTAHEAGAVVLYGRCDEELALPYEPFVEALDFVTTHAPDASLGRFPGDLVRLVADLGLRVEGLPAPISSDPRAEEHRLYEAVASWLATASRDRGMVFVIDDLHWATRPTLQMLLHVVRTAVSDDQARLLVIGTYRDTDVDRAHPLSSLLGDLRRLPGVERLPVEPLTEGEVIEFIQDAAGHELDESILSVARRAHAETDGNPFFVGEILRHFIESGAVHFKDGRWTVDDPDELDVPEGVRDVVGRRLNRLSEAANVVLTAASVIGRDFRLEVVANVADMPVDDVLDVLDEAIRARLVEEVGSDRFRFAHALTRQTLYEELSATRRRRNHRRVVGALESEGSGDLSELSHHAIEAGPVGGDLTPAIEYTIGAGEQTLASRAVADALGFFRQALELIDDADDPPPVLGLRARSGLGQAERDTGDPGYRRTLMDLTPDAIAENEIDIAIESVVANNRGVDTLIGRVDHERVAQIESVLPLVEGRPERAIMLAALAGEYSQHPDAVERRLQLVDEARAIARDSGDDELVARVWVATANADNLPDRLPWTVQNAELSVRAAELSGDPGLRVGAHAQLGFALQGHGRVAESRAAYDMAATIARDEAGPLAIWVADFFNIQHLAWDGDLEATRAEADRLLIAGQELGQEDAINWWGGHRIGTLYVDRSLGEAQAFIGQMADEWPDLKGWRLVQGAAMLWGGVPDSEIEALVDEYQLTDPDLLPPDMFTAALWNMQSLLCRRLGRVDHAGRLREIMTPHRGTWGTNGIWIYVPTKLALMECHATVGDHALAVEDGLAGWEELLGSPVRCNVPAAAESVADVLIDVGDVHSRSRAREIIDIGLAHAQEMNMPLRVAALSELAERLDG